MKQYNQPLAAALSGHQRGAVGERGPGALGQRGIGLGQHLAAHADVARHHHAEERALAREGVELLRLLPRQAAAENTPAASEFYRHEIVVGGREMRTGKAHQHATVVEPAHEAVARLGDVAHVGEDHHRQPLLDELVHGLRRRAAIGEPYIGEGPERAREVVGRGQKRLRGVGGRSGDDADRAPPPALVEQRHRARRALACDFQSRDVVADLHRHRELGLALALAVPEGERGIAEREALEVERAHGAGFPSAVARAQDFHRQRARGIVGGCERARARDTAVDHGDGPLLDEPPERRDELAAAAEIDAVGEPNELDLGRGGEEAPERRQRIRALDRVRLRLDLLDPHARGRRRLEGDVARRLRERDQGDAAVIRFRACDQILGGAHARVPGARRREAVVDQERERRLGGRGRNRRIPQRTGGRDDHERGERQTQQREPPRRALRRLLPGRDVEQEPRRRERDAARLRRNEAQQPPQHRQTQEPEQDQRLGEAEREPSDHACLRACPATRRRPLTIAPGGGAPRRACSASKSSVAGRSVRWMVKLQPSLSVSARISAR